MHSGHATKVQPAFWKKITKRIHLIKALVRAFILGENGPILSFECIPFEEQITHMFFMDFSSFLPY